jgi:hypothetical protein
MEGRPSLLRLIFAFSAFIIGGVLLHKAGGPNRLHYEHYNGPAPDGTLQVLGLAMIFLGAVVLTRGIRK